MATDSVSAEPSSSRRDSMEDADSSLTRKRPRLEGHDRPASNMPADPVQEEPMSGARISPVEMIDAEISQQETEQAISRPDTLQRTPSKVTINVRSHQSDVHQPVSGVEDGGPLEPLDGASTDTKEPNGNREEDLAHGVLTSPHPAPSPEIEVAEVDDMDQDGNNLNWTPIVNMIGRGGDSLVSTDRFPCANEFPHPREAVVHMIQHFERAPLDNLSLIEEVRDWLDNYLTQTEHERDSWYDLFYDDREFWEEFPGLVQVLLKRGKTVVPDTEFASHRWIEDFFMQFARMTVRVLQIDCMTLQHQLNKEVAEEPDLISDQYLLNFLFILQVNDAPLWALLHHRYQQDVMKSLDVLAISFALPPLNGIQHLCRYITLGSEQVPRCPDFTNISINPLQIVRRVLDITTPRFFDEATTDGISQSMQKQFFCDNLAFFKTLSSLLSACADKNHWSFPIELSRDLLVQVPKILYTVAKKDPELAEEYLAGSARSALASVTSTPDLPTILEYACRFDLLRKYIVEGRMEQRVQGIDMMHNELVSAWNMYAQRHDGNIEHPIIRFLATYLLENRIVEYIVGVGSHPQLISRSANIVGFLVVTHDYSSALTDAIWGAVTSSQDPLIVGAILGMLPQVLKLSDYQTLLYFCEKLHSLPFTSFDSRMMAFTGQLLRFTEDKLPLNERLDRAAYSLCIRLIRRATAGKEQCPGGNNTVFQFALTELESLMRLGPSEEDRKLIFAECVKDISDKSKHATGSICALNALVDQHPSADIEMLTAEFDLTRLAVEEMAHTCSGGSESHDQVTVLTSRLTLFHHIIFYTPDTINDDLSKQLWDLLFGQLSAGQQARQSAWIMLYKVAGQCHSTNTFIDRCFNGFLPDLDPSFFTPGTTNFIQATIQYLTRVRPLEKIEETKVIQIPGIEQLWRVILKAIPGSVEIPATRLLTDFYFEIPLIRNAPTSAVEATHVAIVNRCVHLLTSAAKKLEDSTMGGAHDNDDMIVVPSPDEASACELQIRRSLMVLKDVLQSLRARSRYDLSTRHPQNLQENHDVIRGEKLTIRWQSFWGNSQSDIESFELGDLETAAELIERLKKATDFAKFKIFTKGFNLDLEESPTSTLRDLKFDKENFLMIRRVQSESDSGITVQPQTMSTVELEVLKHFQDFYALLTFEERIAAEGYDFLNIFPLNQQVKELVSSDIILSSNELFDVARPYKVLYSLNALQHCLKEQLSEGQVDEMFISRGVRALVSTITQEELLQRLRDSQLVLAMTGCLIDGLLMFLKEPVSNEVSASYFRDLPTLTERLIAILNLSGDPALWPNAEALNLIGKAFAVIIESSLHSHEFWNAFISHGDVSRILESLLLTDRRPQLRKTVVDTILAVTAVLPRLTAVNPSQFSRFFWEKCSALLPRMLDYPDQAEQLTHVSLAVFRATSGSVTQAVDLDLYNLYIKQWTQLLQDYEHREFVGRESVDSVVSGLTNLLSWCIQLVKSYKLPLHLGDVALRLFTKYLFPELSEEQQDMQMTPRIPVLHSQTREDIYELILSLIEDIEGYKGILNLVESLVPQDYIYELSFNFQRQQAIRSPTGFVGLRNLSNTCYLNSLFTQLFMNVGFRNFMINANLADEDASQKLLFETKKLFAFMQDSWGKYADTSGVAYAIRTYDNDQIDVSVQMDVDEFYNLLFDRWEGQILSPADKKTFRSFYGGQLVQQVKSKECPHISEREEPFSAVQCDIKGKASLQDSLKAYVEGEILEGDNKYSCTSCGRHVDAVKRTCLKEVPDNLIFHLKRFDFDLLTMQRSKINDHFEFPTEIDMTPYKIDHLSDPEEPTSSDKFELVGVLVHSGTAESGHYYSYIRERPALIRGKYPPWIEFNDADVTPFDPANIADQCFGGVTELASEIPNMRFGKAWNAYMLFYQRSSTLAAEDSVGIPIKETSPKKVQVPLELSNLVALNNEITIQRYCLYDPAYAPFVRLLLDKLRYLNYGSCSEDHRIEKQALWVALEHVDQVISRTKDIPDFEIMMMSLLRVAGNCTKCCRIALNWVSLHPVALRNLLLRNPISKVRQDFGRLVLTALQHLRKRDTDLYGIDLSLPDPQDWQDSQTGGAFQEILLGLLNLFDVIHMHTRAWDDFFGLLSGMAALGEPESLILLTEDLLHRSSEYLIAPEVSALRQKHEPLLRILERGRKPSYAKLIELIHILMLRIDVSGGTVQTVDDRGHLLDGLPLTEREEEILTVKYRRSNRLIFLSRLFDVNHNLSSSKAILQHLLEGEPDAGQLIDYQRTIVAGVASDHGLNAASYLEAALVFCAWSPSPESIEQLVVRIARDITSSDSASGFEHVDFFERLSTLSNARLDKGRYFFLRLCLSSFTMWVPPLLFSYEESIRLKVIQVLRNLLFDLQLPDEDGGARIMEELSETSSQLALQCTKRIQIQYTDPRVTAESKLVEAVRVVVQECLKKLDDRKEEEATVVESCTSILDELAELTIEMDEPASDWDDADSKLTSDSDLDPAQLPLDAPTSLPLGAVID